MIPSQKWFPTNLPARAAWYANFNTQFAIVASSLGFTNADITAVSNDNTMMQFLADYDTQEKAFGKAVTQFRRIITQGNIGESTPNFPDAPTLANPGNCATGLFERLVDLRERILAAPGYTDEIGALLGILPTQSGSIAPETVKPTVTVSAAQSGYLFAVTVTGRAEADMWEVLILRKGTAGWVSVKTATGKSVDVTITPSVAGESEQIQVRVQLKKKNANYGQPSDIVYVTVNP